MNHETVLLTTHNYCLQKKSYKRGQRVKITLYKHMQFPPLNHTHTAYQTLPPKEPPDDTFKRVKPDVA